MSLLGIDIGTTHIKAGLFHQDGKLIRLAIYKNNSYRDNKGNFYYKPEEVWNITKRAIKEVTTYCQGNIASIGITSMAESGLLIDSESGEYCSEILPWFDRRTEEIANIIEDEIDPLEHFKKTGLRNNYKHGLAKLLWLKQENPERLFHTKWLSVSDFIAYKLTGKFGTDYSLAARTFAFRIDKKEWDIPFINHFKLSESLFPEVRPAGMPIGKISSVAFKSIGLEKGIPVAVSGHDHVCAALAVGAIKPGVVLDSMGTAETLVGSLNKRDLTKRDYDSGFNFGCHVLADRFFWMGAIQASGGSVEWIRSQLSSEQLSYEEMASLLDKTPKEPTGILYYPYLAGSGSPQPDTQAKGAFIGLKSTHHKGDLLRGLLEGTAYEFEYMRRTIESLEISKLSRVVAVGGGTKNHDWMQIKSDISNCSLTIPSISEATVLGAALTAGLGCGVYKDEEEIFQYLARSEKNEILPNRNNHNKYRHLFEEGYLPLQEPLRKFYTSG